jgi:hypothetical protein
LHLWKIRHFWYQPRQLPGLTDRHSPVVQPRRTAISPLAAALMCLSMASHGWGQPPNPTAGPAPAGGAAPGSGAAAGTAKTATAQANPAAATLRKAMAQLAQRATIRATIVERVYLTDPALRVDGQFVSSGGKFRLEYQVKLPGGVQGSLLEVCDTQRLWSVMTLPGSLKVTRRDVQQILSALATAPTRPLGSPSAELALGGLSGLLAGLNRSLQWDAMTEESFEGRNQFVLQGKWRPELLKRLGTNPEKPELPGHLPEATRVYLDAETLFPTRLIYLRKPPERKFLQPLAELRFLNVTIDGPVSDSEFDYTPPENVEPEDTTRQFLEQLLPPEPPAAASGTAPASAAGTPAPAPNGKPTVK